MQPTNTGVAIAKDLEERDAQKQDSKHKVPEKNYTKDAPPIMLLRIMDVELSQNRNMLGLAELYIVT